MTHALARQEQIRIGTKCVVHLALSPYVWCVAREYAHHENSYSQTYLRCRIRDATTSLPHRACNSSQMVGMSLTLADQVR